MTQILKVYSLGKELDSQSVYSDTPLTKKEVAQCLICSRTSIVKWSNIAWLASNDYRKDTPLTNSGYDRESPLTPYQVWMISRIAWLMGRMRSHVRVTKYLKENVSYFSKARFLAIYEQIQEKIYDNRN